MTTKMSRCPRFVHHLVSTTSCRGRSTTALVFSSRPLLCLLVAVMTPTLVSLTSGQLSHECIHPNAEYVWNSVIEAVPLVSSRSLLLLMNQSEKGLSNSVMHCIPRPETSQLVIHRMRLGSSLYKTCEKAIGNMKHILMTGSIEETKRLRFILGFRDRLYYGNDYGTQMIKMGDESVHFNTKFDHQNIESWKRQFLTDKSIHAVGLVQTTDNSPSLPSLLVALEDPMLVRVIKYQPVAWDAEEEVLEKGGEDPPITLGYIPMPINAMYLPSARYADKMTVFLFFDNYYSLITLNLKSEPMAKKTRLEVFPILPAQGIIGCPIHLCWWPALDDLFYHEGIYYLFQGQWMWTFKEGYQHYFYSLRVAEAVDLSTAGINFPLKAVYYDYNFGQMMFIKRANRFGKGKYYIERLVVTISEHSGRAEKVVYPTGRGDKVDTITLKITDEIITATMLDEGQPESLTLSPASSRQLWVVTRKANHDDESDLISFSLQNFDFDTYIYEKSYRKKKFLFPGISAFFYHHRLGHLFILTGYFLYIFQETDFHKLDTSLCSTVEFGHFFNCSGYFDAERMNAHLYRQDKENEKYGHELHEHVFTTAKQFSDDARKYHRGSGDKFLPGQCNFLPMLKNWTAIPFREKIEEESEDGSSSGKLFLKVGVLVVVIIAVAVLFVACLLCVDSRRLKGKGRGARADCSGEKRRLKQELKLKQYLRGQMRSIAAVASVKPARGAGGGKTTNTGRSKSSSAGGSTSNGSYSSSKSPKKTRKVPERTR